MAKPATYTKPIGIYLPSGIVHATLVTRHERLSDHLNLRGDDQVMLLQDVQFKDLQGSPAPGSWTSMIVYVHQVLFVVDLSPPVPMAVAATATVLAKREDREVVVGAGPFWLQGKVHLPPGGELDSFARGRVRFIPLTAGTFLGRETAEPRTFIVNREKIDFLIS